MCEGNEIGLQSLQYVTPLFKFIYNVQDQFPFSLYSPYISTASYLFPRWSICYCKSPQFCWVLKKQLQQQNNSSITSSLSSLFHPQIQPLRSTWTSAITRGREEQEDGPGLGEWRALLAGYRLGTATGGKTGNKSGYTQSPLQKAKILQKWLLCWGSEMPQGCAWKGASPGRYACWTEDMHFCCKRATTASVLPLDQQ